MSSDEIWKNFPGCECLKKILINSGYDNIPSLMCINGEQLTNLEKHVKENRWMTEELTCEHVKSYGKSIEFKFLPGHRVTLLDWCQNKCNVPLDVPTIETSAFTVEHAAFSPIVREIIANALSNHQKPANSHRFSQILMDFSIYIYIMAGKACYEILCANLPLPKSGTVGKFFRFSLVMFLFIMNAMFYVHCFDICRHFFSKSHSHSQRKNYRRRAAMQAAT